MPKDTGAEVSIKLTAKLLKILRDEARDLGVPLEWLVAGLVANRLHPSS